LSEQKKKRRRGGILGRNLVCAEGFGTRVMEKASLLRPDGGRERSNNGTGEKRGHSPMPSTEGLRGTLETLRHREGYWVT